MAILPLLFVKNISLPATQMPLQTVVVAARATTSARNPIAKPPRSASPVANAGADVTQAIVPSNTIHTSRIPITRPQGLRLLAQRGLLTKSRGLGTTLPMLIYKIFRRPEWDQMRHAGQTLGAPVDMADGYIHFSAAPQLAETAAKWFAGESDLVLLAVNADLLGDDLKWEAARGGVLFPHLYRALTMADVVWDKSLPLGASGHIFPEGVF